MQVDLHHSPLPRVSGLLSCSPNRPDTLDRLKDVVGQKAQNGRCLGLAVPGQYQLFQVETPNVPDDELLGAVRWQIRDLIDIPVETAVVDTIPLPKTTRQKSMAYVAAADPANFTEMIDLADSLKLSLQHIDIAELALRNLLLRLPQQEQGVAGLYLGAQQGLFVVVRQGQLCFTRTVGVGSHHLLASEEDQTANRMEQLVLELQRSLDYYESTIGKTTLRSLCVCPLDVEVPGFIAQLDQMLPLEVSRLNLFELFEFDDDYSPIELSRCVLSLGAALKTEGLS